MKPKTSRRTTFWGTLAAVAGAYATFTPEPTSKAVAGAVAALATAFLGISARDHKVSSAEAGIEWKDVPITELPQPTEPNKPAASTPRGPLLALIALLSLGPLSFTGCTTLPPAQSLQNKAAAVAWIAASELLQDRPDFRPAFEIAATDLEFLAQAETLSFAEMWAILDSLPVAELHGRNAALYFGGAMLFFEDELGTVAVENPEQARAIVRGLADGLRRAIK